jgi:hypothetical protein
VRLGDVSVLVFLHFFLEQVVLFWQDVSLGQEVEMGSTVLCLHLGNVFVHQVFSSHVERVGKMVYLAYTKSTFW